MFLSKSCFLMRGLTIADLQSDGKIPSSKVWLTIDVNTGAHISRLSFTILVGIGSNEQDLEFILCTIFTTSETESLWNENKPEFVTRISDDNVNWSFDTTFSNFERIWAILSTKKSAKSSGNVDSSTSYFINKEISKKFW